MHRLSSAVAAPTSHILKSYSSTSSASTNASKKKRNDAEAFLEANELNGTESSALEKPSKQLQSNRAVKPAVPSRQQTSQVNATPLASSSVVASKAAAKAIPAPLLAAAKKAGMSIAQSSTKTAKVPTGSPAVSAAPISVSGFSQSEVTVAIVAQAVNSTPSASEELKSKLPNDDDLQKGTGKSTDRDIHALVSSKAAPSIPVRRKRIVDSDDSDDAPASLPSVAATPRSTDVPDVSPASVAPAKKTRVSILSSRVLAAVTVDAAAAVEESAAGAMEVEQLLGSELAASVACASVATAAIDSSAPVRSGLKIGISV